MKRFLSLFIAALACQAMLAQAVIKFDKTVVNFGNFKEDRVQTCEFVFTNTGDKPLVIQQAYAACGCTVAAPPKAPVGPGKQGVIKVSYNGKGKFKGFFKKPITVRSNASNSIVRVYIQGNMIVDE